MIKWPLNARRSGRVTVSFITSLVSFFTVFTGISNTTTGLRLALRSRVSNDQAFSAYFEDQHRNDSFKYATLPRNFRRKNATNYKTDVFSPDTSLTDSINIEPNTNLVSGAIANLKVLNTMTLGRRLSNNPLTPKTDQSRGAFARVAARQLNTPPPPPPPTQTNTPDKSSKETYRPAAPAAQSPFLRKKLFKYPSTQYDSDSHDN